MVRSGETIDEEIFTLGYGWIHVLGWDSGKETEGLSQTKQ